MKGGRRLTGEAVREREKQSEVSNQKREASNFTVREREREERERGESDEAFADLQRNILVWYVSERTTTTWPQRHRRLAL